MEIFINATIPSLHRRYSSSNAAKFKPIKSPSLRCFRKNGEVHNLFRESSHMESEDHNNMEIPQSLNSDSEMKHNDIWRLFKEAQQNILYLNKQRLVAVEELNKIKKEKQLLLDRIEQLGVEKQAGVGKDNVSICSEVLLRIDSMVLTAMIGTGEASDLRKLVVDHKFGIADVFTKSLQKSDAELLQELRILSHKTKKNGFHIIHICTEMAPMVSIGSVASYVTGLSGALQRKGNLVEVILPKYTSLDLSEVQGLRQIGAEFYSYFNGQLHENRVWTGVVHGIGVTFIEPLYYSSFFNRERIYGYSDDFERFTYFSRASLDYIVKSGKQPEVLHIHNWETAIVGPLLWDVFVNQGLGGTRILLTCHGFDSQRLEQPDKLALCGLDPSALNRPDRLQDNIKTHLVNIIKGGIVYSNKVVIISSMHSKGRVIRMSHELEPTLAAHKDKLIIAPCGFDHSTWDPLKDKFLPEKYSVDNMKGKAICKVALQQHLGLSKPTSMAIVGCILSEFSDVDLDNMKAAVRIASRRNVQFIFMLVSKIPSIQMELNSFEEELKDENVRFINKHDEALSHLIFAGSDIILCQTYHDPLLQVPLKALKYGAAPVSIRFNDSGFRNIVEQDSESSRFSHYINTTFATMSLSQALDRIESNPSQWNGMIADAMTKDFSWDAECSDVHISAYTSIRKL